MDLDGNTTILSSILILNDTFNQPYFSINKKPIEPARAFPISVINKTDITSFLSETLTVSPRFSTPFTTDLTSRDDIFLAISSIIIVALIEAMLTTVLLRSKSGQIHNVSFSIKHFLELAREFRFRFLVFGRHPSRVSANGMMVPRKVNYKLLFLAIFLLSSTLGLEAVLIFLTSPTTLMVTNRTASFSMVETILPDWNVIQKSMNSALTRPCNELRLENVEQGLTRINACLSSSGQTSDPEMFREINGPVDLNFTTDLHNYGGEHYLTIGNQTARFQSRVYFNLGDTQRKMMAKRSRFYQFEVQTILIHRLYIAYLFTHYNRMNPHNQTLAIWQLQNLLKRARTEVKAGPDAVLIKLSTLPRYRSEATRRYETIMRGILPHGAEALRFAGVVLKASTGVRVTGPDLNDLDLGSASTFSREALMWKEKIRGLNWLSLLILIVLGVFCFLILKISLSPSSTTEIAEAVVKRGELAGEWDVKEMLHGINWVEGDRAVDGAPTEKEEWNMRNIHVHRLGATRRSYSDV